MLDWLCSYLFQVNPTLIILFIRQNGQRQILRKRLMQRTKVKNYHYTPQGAHWWDKALTLLVVVGTLNITNVAKSYWITSNKYIGICNHSCISCPSMGLFVVVLQQQQSLSYILRVIWCKKWGGAHSTPHFYQLLINLQHHGGTVWQELTFDDVVGYTQQGNGLQHS